MAPKTRNSCSTWFLVLISANIVWSAVGQDTPLNIQETGTSGSGVNDMNPQSIKVAMQMDKDYLSLNLIKNPNVDNYVPIVLSQNGLLSAWSKQRGADYAVYQDKDNQAAIRVKSIRNSDGTVQRELQGTFVHKNENYEFKPRSDFRRKKRGTDSGSGYTVTKAQPVGEQFGPQQQSNTSIVNYGQMLEYISSVSDQKPNYIVEVLVVVDYAIFKRWFDLSTKSTVADKTDDAVNEIRYYYSQIVNGMDLRYSSIKVSDFTINIKLGGFYIATTPADSPWTEGGDRKVNVDSYVYSDAYKALDFFDDWISQHQNDLPLFDQATLFTGNRLMAGYTPEGYPFGIAGLANIRAICSKGRVSINKEGGEYASTQTASHELGHNLGAYHDGDKNTCSKSDQYIMAAIPSQLNKDNIDHPFHFSDCSIDYMRTYLSMLTLMNTNCLLSTSRVDEGDVEKNGKIPVGQFLNIDKQCQLLYGTDSYYCGGKLFDEQLCNLLYCYNPNPDYQRCVSKVEQRAAEGTSCGNKMWCQFGQCVYNASAPSTPDKCISGDRKGIVADGKTCSEKIRADPALCYMAYWRDTCCSTCDIIRNANTDDCQYGDGDVKYCKNVKQSNCYEDDIRTLCCVSCKKYKTNLANCQYGDRATWCGADDDPSVCYSSSATCCSYCLLERTSYSDCTYGDKAPWCKNLNKSLCHDGNNAQVCCETCDPYKTTPAPGYHVTVPPSLLLPIQPDCVDSASWCADIQPSYCYTTSRICCNKCYYLNNGDRGCEYGDRFDWCKQLPPESCQYIEYQEDCCSTCGATRRKLRNILDNISGSNQQKAYWWTFIATVVLVLVVMWY